MLCLEISWVNDCHTRGAEKAVMELLDLLDLETSTIKALGLGHPAAKRFIKINL